MVTLQEQRPVLGSGKEERLPGEEHRGPDCHHHDDDDGNDDDDDDQDCDHDHEEEDDVDEEASKTCADEEYDVDNWEASIPIFAAGSHLKVCLLEDNGQSSYIL